MQGESAQKPVRHILSLSGGKDSTALAIYMRDRVEGMEYVFCDTGEELPETREYLDRLEAFLGKQIVRLNPDRPFSHYLQIYNGVLPDARTRWCTRKLKIEPFERFVKNDVCYSYVGIRADEAQRKGYISTKPNIIPRYPFVEDNIRKEDVFRILEGSGLGLPKYYEWRSRSGCYFCFFQRKIEWVGLLENHEDLYLAASSFEKSNDDTGERYTWSQGESLAELRNPDRIAELKAKQKPKCVPGKTETNLSLSEVFGTFSDDESNEGCLICHL